jgi:hypothetical protein
MPCDLAFSCFKRFTSISLWLERDSEGIGRTSELLDLLSDRSSYSCLLCGKTWPFPESNKLFLNLLLFLSDYRFYSEELI